MATDAPHVPDLLTGIATTRAIRRFAADPIPDDDLSTIMWHATRAPSGTNRQPTRFVVLREGLDLDAELKEDIRRRIRQEKSPQHVPAHVRQAPDIPLTISGKTVEIAVRNILHDRAVDNVDALANPQALEFFRNIKTELR